MTIGILGAGQLGQMLAQAGIALGQDCVFLDPAEAPCAAVMGDHLSADYDDADALAQLARRSDVVTLEFENVPVATLDTLAQSVPVHPGSRSLACAQDRAEEKALFDRLGIATPTYRLVDSADALREALRDVGAPAVLKNRRFGYDGKGQSVLKSTDDVDAAWDAVGGQPSILEAFVPFQREVSMVAARATDGAMRFYPVTENVHRDGILRLSTPQQDDPLTDAARQATRAVAEALDHVGVLAFEFFDRDGELVANEFAPRVHNSGHWTQDGAVCSQFENHLRAVSGLPLGDTRQTQACAMVNIIGQAVPVADLSAIDGACVHSYAKAPRPGRKVGHVNVVAADAATLTRRLQAVHAVLT